MVGSAAVMVVYVAALRVSHYFDIRSPNAPLVQEVRSVAAALESHRQSRGAYPVLNDRPLAGLKKQLVEDVEITKAKQTVDLLVMNILQ